MRPLTFVQLSAAAGLVLAASLFAAPAPAHAGDDDVAPDVKFLRSLLEGIGLQRDGKESIDYHERPPLVIPNSTALPPPEASGAVVANNPAWPKDPDVARRKEYEKDANRSVSSEEIDSWARPLSPSQMMPGGDRGRTGPRRKIAQPAGVEGQRLTPNELGYRGGLFDFFGKKDDSTGQFTGEPERTTLTEPPAGYQTPSPDQPYGAAKADSAPKAVDATQSRIDAARK